MMASVGEGLLIITFVVFILGSSFANTTDYRMKLCCMFIQRKSLMFNSCKRKLPGVRIKN